MTYGISKTTARKFADAADAQKFGNGWFMFKTAEELAVNEAIPVTDILAAYNKSANKKTKKFTSREKGCEQLVAALDAEGEAKLAKAAPENKAVKAAPENKKAAAKGKAKKAPATEGSTAERAGRQSQNTGKVFKLSEKHLGVNPRRKGTFGHASMEIIIAAGKKGISFEDFIAAGGRSKDLNWDINAQNVEEVETKK